MDKLKLHSPDITEQNIAKLVELFPNCVTETRTDDGEVKQAIDFDQLRQELSGSIVEGPQERYQLNWPGKREALLTANAPIAKTLRPCREESVDFDTTRNLFIEGDNLDALKLLQETYLNKVKVIYIDPPYNTGREFIYDDDFSEDTEAYFQRSNQKDEAGNRMVANSEANGRYHSDWLTMMYPRLKQAHSLLRDDGTIFVSIDDNEVHNLRKLCDEIFSEKNFVANVIWQKVYSPKNSARHFSEDHDYIVIYARNAGTWAPKLLPRTAKQNAAYTNKDDDIRGPWKASDLSARNYYSQGTYSIECPSGRIIDGPPSGTYWRYSNKKFQEMDSDNRIWWGHDGNNTPALKRFLSEVKQGRVPQTLWAYKDVGHTQDAKKELIKYVNFEHSENVLNSVKPTSLIQRILQLTTKPDENAIVLDFFCGSGSTAHAVLKQNLEDSGNRRFIAVQIQEPLPTPEPKLTSILEMATTRVRNFAKEAREQTDKPQDLGFRMLKIDTSNMNDVYYTPDAINQDDLFQQADNIRQDRTPEDLLFQVMLDWGVDLTLPIARESIAGKTVFHVDENALAACFDEGIDETFVKELATRQPLRAVFRDSDFANDSVKINVEQIFKHLSPHTDVKTI
ncbi:site-specific DNA-methyltransferase [bacterium endosymbiont of Escarpia laminata]|nr:MAG: site-specific DNA-methyltransferase [bacterium endosymbiont of Escarpia laminata]